RKNIATLQAPAGSVASLALSQDGRFVLTGGADRVVRLWDVGREAELQKLEGHTQDVRAVALSPAGAHALSCSSDATGRLWNAKKGEALDVIDLATSNDLPQTVAFAPDGRSFYVGTSRGAVLRFELDKGR